MSIDTIRLAWDLPSVRHLLARPPQHPREWTVTLPLPPGEPIEAHGGEGALDELAATLAPDGWYVVGGIAVSRRDWTCAPTWTGWSYRITLWPEVWHQVTTLTAPTAVYAAAQIAGLTTRLDGCLVADCHGVQYRTPDGRPIARQCFIDGRERLPTEVQSAMREIEDIDRRRTVGYMWSRPDTARAEMVARTEAVADVQRRSRACDSIARWVRAEYPHVLEVQ